MKIRIPIHFAVLLTALSLIGCRSTQQEYEERVPGSVTLLVTPQIRVTELDGEKVGEPLALHLLPGSHTIRCLIVKRTYHGAGSDRSWTGMFSVNFSVRAGHVYSLRYETRRVNKQMAAIVGVTEAPSDRPTQRKVIAFGKPDQPVNSGRDTAKP